MLALEPLLSVRSWPLRRWVAATAGAVAVAVLTGVPTGILHTGFYTRMTPVTWWDYPFWVASALLVGLTLATYVRVPAVESTVQPDRAKRTVFATVLSVFAIGCPICNKLVVAVLGVSGALTYFGPIQPLLGAASVGLLAVGLVLRLRGAEWCPVPAR